MARVLALTSPHMVDVDGSTEVAGAQTLLAHNRFADFAPYGDASQAGEFGDTTAAACHRAKFWLGWPAGQTQGTFGANLARVLSTGKIPRAYWLRRQLRLRRARKARKLAALHLAVGQIGKKESPPNSNRVLYSTWYGLIGSWCMMFQTWLGVETGEPAFARGSRWAYVPYFDAAAAAHKYGLSFVPASAVEPGDRVTYDWDRDGTSDHVGIFERWIKAGSTFYAIEGNTAVGDDSNGGEVMRRERSLSQVHHFIRVDG